MKTIKDLIKVLDAEQVIEIVETKTSDIKELGEIKETLYSGVLFTMPYPFLEKYIVLIMPHENRLTIFVRKQSADGCPF